MAGRKEMDGAYDEAIGLWKRCRESVMDGTHPYYTTRQALPLIKIGQLFLASGRREEARDYLEQYVSSEYGSKEANDVFVLLGNLYEESGAWDKAKALYDHYSQFSYYSDVPELKRRLSLPEPGALLKAQELLVGLRGDDRTRTRTARNALYELILSSGNTDAWVRWLTRGRSTEESRSACEELEILMPLLTPLAEVGDRSIRGDVSERLKRMEEDLKQNRAYEELLDALFSRQAGNTYMNARQLGFGGPYTLAGLSSTSDFRDVMEKLYAQVRTRLLNPDNEKASDLGAKAASDGLLEVLREHQTFRDCLKKCVSLQVPQSGLACLFLYALGFKEDIAFIIDHIPEDAYKRNQMMLWLAAGLYRERTVDIPKVMGCDKAHVRDWWNVDTAGKNVPQAFRDWWSTKKERFEYSAVEAAGYRVFGTDFTSRMTAIAPAPEIDGVFFFVEGGFLDYSGSVYFFSFLTGECRPIIDEGRDVGQGVYASATAKWRQSGNRIGSLSALSLGPGVQRHGDLTVEIRRGDLFLVNETSGRETCIESFGYILSFTLNRQGTKLLTVDREILGQSLNLYDIEEKVALLQTH
jgi:tetratricopeptide (TPR) repeat protein